jgi:hypothetical protein
MKVVGKRRPQAGLKAAESFLKLVLELREHLEGRRPFVKKGVYRFRTFEDAQQAALKAQAQKPKRRSG